MSKNVEKLLSLCRELSPGALDWELFSVSAHCGRELAADASLQDRAARELAALPPAGQACLAGVLGFATGAGAPAEISAPHVLEVLRRWLAQLPAWEDDEAIPEPTSDQQTLLQLLPELGQAVGIHVIRLPALQAQLASEAQLLKRLTQMDALTFGARFVMAGILRTSGELVLLHAESGRACRIAFRHVANCFHLFSLIQGCIGERFAGGTIADESVLAAARSEADAPDLIDEAWWHYGTADSNKADLGASVWGEGTIQEIPRVDETLVIIAWPKIVESRQWNGRFFSPRLQGMPSGADFVAELSKKESARWFERLNIEQPKKPWWKF